jgi:hypothetical protein
MGGKINTLAGALAAVWALQAPPAGAQYMMHLDPNLYIMIGLMQGAGADPCMAGTAMSAPKIAEARGPAPAVMQAYFRAAQGGGLKSAVFHLDKNTRWQAGGATAGSLDLDRQSDPLAAPGNTLEAEPLRFYRGGTGATALGQWAVLDAAGQVAGVYTGFFTRAKKAWRLRELTVSQAGETVAPAAQYCRKPGDVIEHRLTANKTWRESAQKSVDEARAKLAGAEAKDAAAKDAAAKAALAARPRDSRLSLNASEARRNVSYWTKQLETRQKNLTQASEKLAEAEKDAAEIKRLTGEARNARAFRVAAAETAAAK